MYGVETGIMCVERDERRGGMSAHFSTLTTNACASLLVEF